MAAAFLVRRVGSEGAEAHGHGQGMQPAEKKTEIAKFVQAGAPQSPAANKSEAKPGSSGRPRQPRPHSNSSTGFNAKNNPNNPQKCACAGSDGKCKTRTVS